MRANPVDKDAVAVELRDVRALFTKSVALKCATAAGTVLTESLLTVKKPGTGIAAGRLNEVIGRRLVRAVGTDRILQWSDLDD